MHKAKHGRITHHKCYHMDNFQKYAKNTRDNSRSQFRWSGAVCHRFVQSDGEGWSRSHVVDYERLFHKQFRILQGRIKRRCKAVEHGVGEIWP